MRSKSDEPRKAADEILRTAGFKLNGISAKTEPKYGHNGNIIGEQKIWRKPPKSYRQRVFERQQRLDKRQERERQERLRRLEAEDLEWEQRRLQRLRESAGNRQSPSRGTANADLIEKVFGRLL